MVKNAKATGSIGPKKRHLLLKPNFTRMNKKIRQQYFALNRNNSVAEYGGGTGLEQVGRARRAEVQY